ncbi:MAG: SEC-C domain-containing protein [Acidimicrobiales bacterium]
MTDEDESEPRAVSDDPTRSPQHASALDLGAMDEIRPGAWMGPSEQMVVSDRLIAGLWFAHKITEHELVAGWLEVAPDFTALAAFARRYTTPTGDEVRVVEPGADERVPATAQGAVLLGPEGWLDQGFADADVLVSVDEGILTLRWAPREEAAPPEVTAVAEVFDGLGGGASVSLLELVLHTLIKAPELFGPSATPLRDLLAQAGLVATGSHVSRAGAAPRARPGDTPQLPGLRLETSLAAQRLLQSIVEGRATNTEAFDDDIVLVALRDHDAVTAVAEQVVGAALVEPGELGRWLDRVTATALGPERAATGFLRSRLAEWTGDLGAEESALMSSIHTAELPAALVDAAWFASDRGDARSALALLRAAGVANDDPEAELLRSFTVAGPNMVGRNERCWCGSGRKHKHCCLRLNGHGLETRARWLHAKAVTFLQRPPQRPAMLSIAVAHAGVTAPDEAPDRVVAAACDATVTELCLFDGEVFDRFVERRGRLLPDDELELAQSWLDHRHELWHVIEGRAALRNHETEAEVELDERSAAKLPEAGAVLAVVLPGPTSLPGPVLAIPDTIVDEVATLVRARNPTALASRIGVEFGWTAAPDLSFARSRSAGTTTSVP